MRIYDLRIENNDIVYTTGTFSTTKLNNIVNLTRSQLTTLVSNSQLQINNLYSISDSFHGGVLS